jgi:hypothetical protein
VINYHLKVNLAIPQVTQTEYNKDQIYQGCFLGLYRTPADFDNRDYVGTSFVGGVPSLNSHRAYRQAVNECWR